MSCKAISWWTSFKTIYFWYIPSFLNYANIAWASTHFTKLKTISYKRKQAACIVFDEDWLCHWRTLLRRLNSLNVYQINLFQHLNLMHSLTLSVFCISHDTYYFCDNYSMVSLSIVNFLTFIVQVIYRKCVSHAHGVFYTERSKIITSNCRSAWRL